MSFVRTAKRENPFVQIDKYFLDDKNLTWGAKGILAYILSKPDTWKVRKEDLVKRSGDGKAKIEAALLNLMANGYIHWYQEKNEDGTFGEWVYDVYERPEFNPVKEDCIKEGQARINNKKAKTKERNTKNTPKANYQLSDSPKVNYPLSDNPTSDNQPYSNNDFSNNDFSNNYLEEEEEGSANITALIDFYEKNISNVGKEAVKNKLLSWLEVLPYEVIKLELENCSLYGAKSWFYVEKALTEDKQQNIITVEQLQQKYSQHQEKNKQTKRSSAKGKRTRVEQLPDWWEENPYQQQQQKEPGKSQEELKEQQAEVKKLLEALDEKPQDDLNKKRQDMQSKLAAFRGVN